MNWDYNQEIKDKYAAHVKKCADGIRNSEGLAIWAKINNLWCFLDGCGYSESTIQTLKDSVDYFCNKSDIENLIRCINDFAESMRVMELPQRKDKSAINITNSNNQTNNIKFVEEALTNELSTSQIEELKTLLNNKTKRGDVKEWLSNLGNNTLSGILSTLITNLPGLSNLM